MLLFAKFYHYWSLKFPTTSIFVKIYDKNNKNYLNMWRIKLYLSNFLFCIKNVSLHQFRILLSMLLQMQSFDKGQRTKNGLHIAIPQQTELPHPLLRSSSSKTSTIVHQQRYTRIKYTCKAFHLQKLKSFGRGPEYPVLDPPPPPLSSFT